MRLRREWREGRVTEAREVAEGVRLLEFAVDGPMPPFDPGSHTEFEVNIDGRPAIRSYTCLPAACGSVRVAVRRHQSSRGGSRYMWSLGVGDRLRLTVPENRFSLSWRAPAYLLVAGGIGITPIYGMARALNERGAPVRLAYGARTRESLAFADDLKALLGERASFHVSQEGERIDLASEIDRLAEDGELYICGPVPMLEAARSIWRARGRPVSRFRCEVFGDSGAFAELPFRVDVADRGVSVDVPSDKSMLQALIDAGVEMIYDCERGECGLCAVDIVGQEGQIDHRDVFFDETEKAENSRMCTCVSRLPGGTVRIDTGFRA